MFRGNEKLNWIKWIGVILIAIVFIIDCIWFSADYKIGPTKYQ
jgi:uncharacterized protein YpmS